VGAKPELKKGRINSGNMKPVELSAVFESNPKKMAIHVMAIINSMKIPTVTSQSVTPPLGLKPTINAVPIITAVVIVFLTIEAMA